MFCVNILLLQNEVVYLTEIDLKYNGFKNEIKVNNKKHNWLRIHQGVVCHYHWNIYIGVYLNFTLSKRIKWYKSTISEDNVCFNIYSQKISTNKQESQKPMT